ncbi:C4-dicarboxylate transporter DcuC [Azotosporobacter soli]|uniref:C4-dicarboxylate transporter DcuC n=1 Tax=Azotosporobacter soli TaxID=3055040 RepID=UPI0031FEB25C
MVYLGAIIILLTGVAVVKRYEVRMVLFLSGLLMAALAGKPLEAIDAFAKAMVNPGLVTVILTVMGFAYVMKLTQCDAHLVQMLAGLLRQCRPVLIPGAVMVTFVINIALPSAAGCAAAVGAILIPTLMSAGVHPAVAGAAIFAGTIGSVLSPGATHNPFVAKLANMDVLSVIAVHSKTTISAAIIGALVLAALAYLRKEDRGWQKNTGDSVVEQAVFKINFLKAIVPLVPLVMLLLGSKQVHLIPEISVPQAMISGTLLAYLVTRQSPQEISKAFFEAMGSAYAGVMGIIIAAATFTTGMQLIGLTDALIEAMKNSQSIVKLAATFGPFLIAVLCGSGDAATLAFNGAITPHAQHFGLEIAQLGSLAQLTGALGRTMSPLAGAAIICAQLSGVSPMEIAKRNAPGMLIAAIVSMFMLL